MGEFTKANRHRGDLSTIGRIDDRANCLKGELPTSGRIDSRANCPKGEVTFGRSEMKSMFLSVKHWIKRYREVRPKCCPCMGSYTEVGS